MVLEKVSKTSLLQLRDDDGGWLSGLAQEATGEGAEHEKGWNGTLDNKVLL
jgi:hypothetical protein